MVVRSGTRVASLSLNGYVYGSTRQACRVILMMEPFDRPKQTLQGLIKASVYSIITVVDLKIPSLERLEIQSNTVMKEESSLSELD